LVGLNRKFAQSFLKYNARLFTRMYNQRFHEISLQINELSTRCDQLREDKRRSEEKDRVRMMMASETGEETLRYLVEKYISKQMKNEEDDNHDE
jgi:hypothetical protein